MHAVRAVDIGVRGRAEHGRIARRHAAIRVRSRVQPVIRFRFHDAPAHAVDQHGHADQLARHAAGIVRKIDTREDFFHPAIVLPRILPHAWPRLENK